MPPPEGLLPDGAIPDHIVCVDCGGTCHLITFAPPDEPFQPGDIVAYRCADCLDRWDIELTADALGDTAP